MQDTLALTVSTAFGLAFDIERAPDRASGFRPAPFDLGAGKDLFGDLRLEGFAALLRIGFARQLILVGGDEGRYKNTPYPINRAVAIGEMLIKDYGISTDRIRCIPSRSNTSGNVAIIKAEPRDSTALVTNLYHIPRASLDLWSAELSMPSIAAEAFILIENPNRKNELIERLGGSAFAERAAEEIHGIADKLRGTYKPRTDAPALPFVHSRQRV